MKKRFPGGMKTFNQLLRYMYGGAVDVHTTDAFSLLSGANQLLVKGNLISKTKGLLLQYLKQHKLIDPILFLRQMLEHTLLDDEMLEGAATMIADELERLWKTQDPSFLEILEANSMITCLPSDEYDDVTNATLVQQLEEETADTKPQRGFAIWEWLGLPYPVGSSVLKKMRTYELISKCAWKYLYEAVSRGGIAPDLSTTNKEDYDSMMMMIPKGEDGDDDGMKKGPVRMEVDLHEGLRCDELLALLKMVHGSPSLSGLFFVLHNALTVRSEPLIEFCTEGIATRFGVDEKEQRTGKESGKGKEKEKKGDESEKENMEEEGETDNLSGFLEQLRKLAEAHNKDTVHSIVCDVLRRDSLALPSETMVFSFIRRYLEKASSIYQGTWLTEEDAAKLWETLRPQLCDDAGWKEFESSAENVPYSVVTRRDEKLKELMDIPASLIHQLSEVRKTFGLRNNQSMLLSPPPPPPFSFIVF